MGEMAPPVVGDEEALSSERQPVGAIPLGDTVRGNFAHTGEVSGGNQAAAVDGEGGNARGRPLLLLLLFPLHSA
jgi:hypothetical protein